MEELGKGGNMVEWKRIGDICSNVFAGGTPSTKRKDYYDGDIPWIRSGEIDFNVIKTAERNITELGYKESSAKMIRKNSVVMAMTGATVAKSAVVSIETTANQSVCAMETDENIAKFKYVYYFLAKDYFKIKSSAQGALTSLNLAMIKNILIPIPSLEEQERIVGILDTFTASIENLKEQIAQRRKQYEHYRDQLLDLEGKKGVEMKTLGEIVSSECTLSYGIVQPGDDFNDGVPVVRPVDLVGMFVYKKGLKKTTKAISDSYKRTILNGNEILLCVRGTTGIMSLATKELNGCNVTRVIVPLSFDNDITKMYVYHVLKTNKLQRNIADKTNGTALKQINIKDLRLLNLPIHSFDKQTRIVSILDTFEASISNLEAQLKQREKQYEYYRNKLLTFE